MLCIAHHFRVHGNCLRRGLCIRKMSGQRDFISHWPAIESYKENISRSPWICSPGSIRVGTNMQGLHLVAFDASCVDHIAVLCEILESFFV